MDLGGLLNVAISMALMYLMLSLFCTVINEWIAYAFKLRASFLRQGLQRLADGSPFFYQVLAHPLVRGAAPRIEDFQGDDRFKSARRKAREELKRARAEGRADVEAVAERNLAALLSLMGYSASQDIAEEVMDLLDAADPVAAANARVAQAGKEVAAAGGDPAAQARLERARRALAVVEMPVNTSSQAAKSTPAPSYLAGQSFAAAVLDNLNPAVKFTDSDTHKAILEGIERLPDARMRDTLRAVLNNATNDLTAARNAVAHWFDTEMERLEGLYKKRMQAIALGVGIVVAGLFNADTIHVAGTLWRDQDGLAARIAESASATLQNAAISGVIQAREAVAAAKKAEEERAAEVAKLGPEVPEPAKQALEDARKNREAKEAEHAKLVFEYGRNIASAQAALEPFPIGWPNGLGGLSWTSLFGWILTGLALSLGSSFWFDTLNKFVNIRSGGPKPPTTPLPDKPAK